MRNNKIMAVMLLAVLLGSGFAVMADSQGSDADPTLLNLYGMGSNQYGQQGDDTTTTNVTTPTQIGSFSNVTDISASAYTTFFIDSGKLYGMGANGRGQQGNGTTTIVTTPTQIGSFSNVTDISATAYTTFFIDSGRLYGMGENENGQQGNGITTDVKIPTQIGSFSNVTHIYASTDTTFFIDSGKLYGMGHNQAGQQGNGTTTNVKIPTQIGSFSNVTDISASANTTFFIDSGKLYGMGYNWVGQQGNGTTTNVLTPTQIGSFSNVTDISASANTTFFIDSGRLYGMGSNQYGQQGDGTTTNVLTPTQIGSFSNVTHISAQNFFALFVDSGKLYGMGTNQYGQQGDGTTTNVLTPTQIGSFSNVTDISASTDTTFFIDSGKLYGMGHNQAGQQGDGTTTNVLTPTQIGSFSNVTHIYASTDTTFFLSEPSTYIIQISSQDYGTVSINSVQARGGTLISASGDTLTIGSTTVTATPSPSDNQYTYAFDSWSGIPASGIVTEDLTITANFTRTLTEHTITVESNNTAYGTVSTGSLTGIPYGETFTVSGNTFTIHGSTVTASPNAATVEYEYSFDEFQTGGIPLTTGTMLTDNMTVRAVFYATQITWSVTVASNNTAWGTVNQTVLNQVPGGSYFTVNGTSMILDSNTFTAAKSQDDAQYTYSFLGWFDALTGGNEITSSTRVLSDMTVYARFAATVNQYDITIQDDSSGYGSVDAAALNDLDYGTQITISGNTLTVGSTTVTASPLTDTAQYDYAFVSWTVGGSQISGTYTVTGDAMIQANFARNLMRYTVTFESNNYDYGTVLPDLITAEYGAILVVSGDTVTVGTSSAVATPTGASEGYSYAFDSWSSVPATLTEDITITATFSRSAVTYTVTFEPNNAAYGSVSSSAITDVAYGTQISVSGSTVTISGSTVTAEPEEGYRFVSWTVQDGAVVSSDMTITANFAAIVYVTITFDATTNGGTLSGSATKTVGQGEQIGTMPTAEKSGEVFQGWYTSPSGGTRMTANTVVTADSDFTLYAQYDITGWGKTMKTIANLFPILLISMLILGYIGVMRGRA